MDEVYLESDGFVEERECVVYGIFILLAMGMWREEVGTHSGMEVAYSMCNYGLSAPVAWLFGGGIVYDVFRLGD